MIPTETKKDFLEFFQYMTDVDKNEIEWLLTYVKRTDRILRKVIFVRDVSSLNRGLFISTTCGKDNESMRFYFEGKVIKEVDRAFNIITRYGDDPIYIQLDYEDIDRCVEYKKVLESSSEDEHDLTDYELKQVADFIKHLERDNMNNLLDKALDTGNKKEFEQLVRNNKGA